MVRVDPGYFRPKIVIFGDASLARDRLGWSPQIPFQTMVNDMVKNDIAFFETVVLTVRDIFSMADENLGCGHNGMVGSAILRRLKTESCRSHGWS